MNRENLAGCIFVASALVVMGLSFYTRSSIPIPRDVGKAVGIVIFCMGMLLFAWATICLRQAFLGTVVPISEQLVLNGPYRWVRHPLYLSMIITLLGIIIVLESLGGIISLVVLFLPSSVYRAKLEERALAKKFGQAWDAYVAGTYFIVPWFW
jgi:protein-S-isoprenylcysteine O-methyltransferase Ste14